MDGQYLYRCEWLAFYYTRLERICWTIIRCRTIGTVWSASRKLIKNVNNKQEADIATTHSLDCLQGSVMKVRYDLNNSDSSHCSVCYPCCWCLWTLAHSQTQLQLVNWHCHCDRTQKNTQLGKLGRICLFGFLMKFSLCFVTLHGSRHSVRLVLSTKYFMIFAMFSLIVHFRRDM